MTYLNINTYVNDTVKNMENAISKYKNVEDLSFLEKFIQNIVENKVLLLGGKQIQGSLSPFMHNYFSAKLNKNKQFFYTLANLEKIEDLDITKVLQQIEEDKNILGANITMPYKIEVYNILKSKKLLDDSALLVGAVNTISKNNGKLFGYNTDIEGIRKPLLKKDLSDIKKGYIFGAGGAAKAAVSALLSLGITNIVIFNRRKKDDFIKHFLSEKTLSILKSKYGINNELNIKMIKYNVLDNVDITGYFDKPGIMINALPFGFKEDLPKKAITDEMFEKIKNKIKIYFDVVYDLNKDDTPLLKQFKQNNIDTFDGLDMVVNQAVKGFELWTDNEQFDEKQILSILKSKGKQ